MRSAAAFALAMSASLLVLYTGFRPERAAADCSGSCACPLADTGAALTPAPSLTPAPCRGTGSCPAGAKLRAEPARSVLRRSRRSRRRPARPAPTTGQSQARPPQLSRRRPQRSRRSLRRSHSRSARLRRPPPPAAAANCAKPGALGIARTVEIDTTGGPGFGFEHFKQHDFLRDKEVVLTFDDGPWLNTTAAVVKALADECVRATFFIIGKHATYYPEILRQVAAGGHSVGSHTWSHQDLSKKTVEEAKAEVEKAVSAIKWALGDQGQQTPFFRFPALRHPPEMVTYLGERNIAIFSTDLDSFDFKLRKPDADHQGGDDQAAEARQGHRADARLPGGHRAGRAAASRRAQGRRLQDRAHEGRRTTIVTLPQYDEELAKESKLPTVSQRPTSSVVQDGRLTAARSVAIAGAAHARAAPLHLRAAHLQAAVRTGARVSCGWRIRLPHAPARSHRRPRHRVRRRHDRGRAAAFSRPR